MKQLVRILDAVLSRALILLMFLLVASVLWQVISRYIFSSPSSWTEELARFLLIWISLLGAAWAFRGGMHLALDILPRKVSGAAASGLRLAMLLIILVFSASVLVFGGASLVQLTWELKQYSAVLGLPMSWVYSVIPAAGLLICLYALAALVDDSVSASSITISEGE